MLVDSHCHLDFPEYSSDLSQVVARARQAGVRCMLTIATHVSRVTQVLAVAEQHHDIYCTVGIHPHEVGREPEIGVTQLVNLAQHPKVVGFGETGLDYCSARSLRADQRQSFHVHIAAARQTGLPVIIHSRDADDDMATILQEEMAAGPFTGLLHCYSSGPALAARALTLGLLVSISGIVTFRKAERLGEIVRTLPLKNLLVETDAPFLAPVPRRGQRNEPAFLVHTAEKIAALKESTMAEVADATTSNFVNLFTKINNALLESRHGATRCA